MDSCRETSTWTVEYVVQASNDYCFHCNWLNCNSSSHSDELVCIKNNFASETNLRNRCLPQQVNKYMTT